MTRIPDALRRRVIDRAQGCCEYCLVSRDDTLVPHEVDHIIAEKHEGDHGTSVEQPLSTIAA